MVKDTIKSRLKEIGLKMDFIDKDLGYELHSADPIPFDLEYTRDLGFGALKFLASDLATQFGAVISFVDGRLIPLSFESMILPESQRMRPRKVNVESESFQCARRYMIRLEPEDFTNSEKLKSLASVTNLAPEKFRERFEKIRRFDRLFVGAVFKKPAPGSSGSGLFRLRRLKRKYRCFFQKMLRNVCFSCK